MSVCKFAAVAVITNTTLLFNRIAITALDIATLCFNNVSFYYCGNFWKGAEILHGES